MSDDTVPHAGSACPSCGVTVSAGYPKCPKCHAAMPGGSQGRPAFMRDGAVAGGTSLEPSSAMAWLAGMAALLLIGGGTIYFLTRDGGAKKSADTTARATPVVAPKAFVPGPGQPDPGFPAVFPDASAAAATAQDRSAAVRILGDALSAERLWSDVELAPGDTTSLVLRTAYCADTKIRAVIDKVRPALTSAKLRSLRCEARHGALVFELDL